MVNSWDCGGFVGVIFDNAHNAEYQLTMTH